jgi:CheY-like chemotaxis protein
VGYAGAFSPPYLLIPQIREKDQDIPIGLITASSQPDTREEAMQNGANQIILKPYSPTDIFQSVEAMLV